MCHKNNKTQIIKQTINSSDINLKLEIEWATKQTSIKNKTKYQNLKIIRKEN
jgi:hypothetical protein